MKFEMPASAEDANNMVPSDVERANDDSNHTESISGMNVMMKRPTPDDLYGLFFEGKDGEVLEVAMLGGSRELARKNFDAAAKFLRSRSWGSSEEAKAAFQQWLGEQGGFEPAS